jgi:3-hydroxybutyrate dehydrogenase
MSLKGKVAVVTGSTSGIGLAIAKSLASAGANVLINGLETQEKGDAIAKQLADAHGVKALFSAANMMKPDEIAAMVNKAGEAWGSVDILVNNAGIQHTAPVQEFPLEKWDAIIAINLSALFHSTRAALPYMQKKGWGRIINTASVHGLVASVHKAAYVAAKHGVVGLTKVTALENADRGITCNAICPGWVDTPLIQQQIVDISKNKGISIDEATKELVGAKQPSKSFVQPENLGALALFLCSDAAAGLTGTALPVDGGWTAQ